MPKLRASEWLLLAFFSYVSLLACFRLSVPRAVAGLFVLVAAAACLIAVAHFASHTQPLGVFRDFLPIGLTLVAFREMELFHTGRYNEALERALLGSDRWLFEHTSFSSAIQALGRAIPEYLELCYLLVYALPFVCIGLLYGTKQRREINRFYLVYLSGTLLAYAFFPFLPLRPPRIVFPHEWPPGSHLILHRLNLFLLQNGSIHTAVLPSAHVSSALSAAFGMLLFSEKHRWIWSAALFFYAVSVAIATVYGRYHYLNDVLAGFVVSLVALAVGVFVQRHCQSTSE